MTMKKTKPTYNGIPKQVIIEAFAAKRQIGHFEVDSLLEVIFAANVMGLSTLETWCWNNTKSIAQLKQAMDSFVSGALADNETYE